MFEQFMVVKRGEGLGRLTIEGYYQNYGYFQKYINHRELTTEFFVGWITHMTEELDFSPHTVNIRVRTMRTFVKYANEEKGWISELIHRRLTWSRHLHHLHRRKFGR